MAKRTKKKPKKIFKIFSVALIIISIILISSIIYFNTLPTIYLLLIIGGVALIDIILVLLMLKSKIKKISSIISFFIMIIMLILSFYIFKTAGLLDNLNLNYKTYNYSVVVLKDGNYKEIDDIENKNLAYFDTKTLETDKSLTKLKEVVSTNNIEYSDYHKMASDLLDEEIEAMLIENSYLQILKENDGKVKSSDRNTVVTNSIEDFSEKIEVIYTFSIKLKTSDITKDLDVTKETFNIYVSGIDTYGSISSVSRSDVNMVVTVNPNTQQILLTSIPRDYYVQLHGISGYKDKLTHAGLYGVDMSIQTLEDLLDIEINYYIKVNFTSVIDIVDALGGVEVYSDYTFTSRDKYNYQEGYNQVNGKEALSFSRERKAFSAGDRQRVKNQQALLEAIFKKVTSPAIITKYNSLLNSISSSFMTNMSKDRLTSLLKMQLSNNYDWNITSNSLEGIDSSNYTYSYSSQKLYVMEQDEESVSEAKQLIASVSGGETLEKNDDRKETATHKVTQNSSSTSENNTKTDTKETTNDTTTKTETKEGLKAKLGRSSVNFVEGDTYIYYGYTATYNKEDVTEKTDITFSINGKSFTKYQDLVEYITNHLTKGEYNIVYKIGYNNESTTLSQSVIIEENTALTDSQDDTTTNTENNNVTNNTTNNNDVDNDLEIEE